MHPSSSALVAAAGLLLAPLVASQQIDPTLVGTWTTKSRRVFTGPGFYDPVNERVFEPALTGISYSFTADGHYEEAYYRAIANPINPSCPKGIIQWQHGSVVQNPDGSLSLTPIAVDGRQLLSDPCTYKTSLFTRYNQSETFVKFERLTDPYNSQERLNLYEWDGTPLNPMWLAYSPPEMLPTSTLNPIATATAGAAGTATTAAAAAAARVRRNLGIDGEHVHSFLAPPMKHLVEKTTTYKQSTKWLWIGLATTGLGGALLMFS